MALADSDLDRTDLLVFGGMTIISLVALSVVATGSVSVAGVAAGFGLLFQPIMRSQFWMGAAVAVLGVVALAVVYWMLLKIGVFD